MSCESSVFSAEWVECQLSEPTGQRSGYCLRRLPISAAKRWGDVAALFVAEIARGRRQYLEGFHLGFDNWHSTHSAENTELSQDIYRKLKAAGLVYTKPVEQFYDTVKGIFLADRYIKGECPNCGAREQYGAACTSCVTVFT